MDTLFLTKEARIYSEKRQPLHEVVLEKLDSYAQKNEIRTLPNAIQFSHSVVSVLCDPIDCSMPCFPVLTPYTKTHSKILCGPPPTVMEIKAKVSKGDLLKSFCTTKETINKIKRQSLQQKRRRCIERTFGLCGRGRGWDGLGEWH